MKNNTRANISSRMDQLQQAMGMGEDKEIAITLNLSQSDDPDGEISRNLSQLAALPLWDFEKAYKLRNKGYLCRLVVYDPEGYHIETAEIYQINFDNNLKEKEIIKHDYKGN